MSSIIASRLTSLLPVPRSGVQFLHARFRPVLTNDPSDVRVVAGARCPDLESGQAAGGIGGHDDTPGVAERLSKHAVPRSDHLIRCSVEDVQGCIDSIGRL